MKGYEFTFEITAEMIHKLNLRTTHLLVFALLDHYTKKNGCCVLGCGAIADMLGMNKTTVYTCIRSLHAVNHYIDLEKTITREGTIVTKMKTIV